MVRLRCPSLMAADVIKLNGHEGTLSGQISISRMCVIVSLCLARPQFCVTSPGTRRQQFCSSRCSPALCLALNGDFSLWWPPCFSQVWCQQAPQVLIICKATSLGKRDSAVKLAETRGEQKCCIYKYIPHTNQSKHVQSRTFAVFGPLLCNLG